MENNTTLLIVLGTIGFLIALTYFFIPKYRRLAANSARFFIGIVFLLSGFVKMVDPLGANYKIEDYLTAFGLDFMLPLSLVAAIGLNLAEFLIGFVLIFGVRMKLFAWGSFLFMLFFTPLTLYLAIENPVSDCGCFGDALIMSNWETFYKNIVFIIMAIIVFLYRKKYWEKMIPNWFKNSVIAVGLIVGIGVQVYALRYDAIMDFRPWKIGNHISSLVVPTPEKSEIYLIYKNTETGQTEEYTSETLPWQDEEKMAALEFVEQKKVVIEPFIDAPIHDFMVVGDDGTEITSFIMNDPNYHFILVSHDLTKTNKKGFERANNIAVEAFSDNILFTCITGSTFDEIEKFKQENDFDLEYTIADPTALKTIIRTNPGLVLLKEGYVIDKWAHRRIPTYEVFKSNVEKYKSNLEGFKENR